MIDNVEIEKVLSDLEALKDEALAVKLLKEFNDRTKELGVLIMNQDKSLSHDDWKARCDEARERVGAVLKKIDEAKE